MKYWTNKRPMILAYGMGVDSTAILVGLQARRIRPDAILFADVGAEKQSTYAYLPIINGWLESVGFPQVTVVKYEPKSFKNYPPYHSLLTNCLSNGTLPSEAFGFGSCSIKWKQQPQLKWTKEWQPAIDAWARGQKVTKLIGYDATECKRSFKASKAIDKKYLDAYQDWFPLQDWGWTREECKAQIAAAGLPVPPKSSCYFCPNMKPAELQDLNVQELINIVIMETRAAPRLKSITGLWRENKGLRTPANKRPGTMTQYIEENGMLDQDQIDHIKAETSVALVRKQQQWDDGVDVPDDWDEWLVSMRIA